MSKTAYLHTLVVVLKNMRSHKVEGAGYDKVGYRRIEVLPGFSKEDSKAIQQWVLLRFSINESGMKLS